MKKINEITTLCGIDACAIIYDENNPRPVVCPSEVGVHMVLDKFKSFPELEQRKMMVDHEGLLRKTMAKAQEKLKKQKMDTKNKEMNNIIGHFIHTAEFNENVSESDLEDLSLLIDENLKEIKQKIELIQAQT